MRKIIKLFMGVLLFTAIIMCLGSYKRVNPSEKKSIEKIESYEVETNMTYEEKAMQLMSKFSSINASINGDELSFDASLMGTAKETKIVYMSSSSEKIEKKYDAKLNVETGIVNLTISYILDDKIIECEEYEASPYYFEAADDYFIDVNDETISVKDMIENGAIEECIAIADDVIVGGVLVAALVLCVVCNDPTYQRSVQQVVTTVTETVTEFVKSFISWFKSIFQKVVRTVVKTVVTIVEEIKVIYNITVNCLDYTLEAVDSKTQKDEGKYYLALANYLDGNVYLSSVDINKDIAIAIMSTYIEVPLYQNEEKRVLLSTYTCLQEDAKHIAEEGSFNKGYNRIIHLDKPHISKKGTYYPHYHPSPYGKAASPHSFFGTPIFLV